MLGHILDGFKKGLEYEAKAGRILAWAVKHGKTDCLQECAHIGEMQAVEALDEAGNVKGNLIGAVLGGSDPFSGSRHATQALIAKWGVQAGVKP
jgi:hypothetical protein